MTGKTEWELGILIRGWGEVGQRQHVEPKVSGSLCAGDTPCSSGRAHGRARLVGDRQLSWRTPGCWVVFHAYLQCLFCIRLVIDAYFLSASWVLGVRPRSRTVSLPRKACFLSSPLIDRHSNWGELSRGLGAGKAGGGQGAGGSFGPPGWFGLELLSWLYPQGDIGKELMQAAF